MSNSVSDHPWQDKETLEQLHFEDRLTQAEIAERLGCSRRTVGEWFSRHDIDARKGRPRVPWVYYRTSVLGYERWQDKHPPSKDKMVKVHRLLAVAEYGFERVSNSHVHHKNGIPWDNRPENIEVLSPSRHQEKHHELDPFDGENNPNSILTEDEVIEIRRREGEQSVDEFAAEFDVSRGCIDSVLRRKTWEGLEPTSSR